MDVNQNPVCLVSAVRTPIGSFGGSLKDVAAYRLAALCIREALTRASIDGEEVDEVIIGQVGQVGRDAYNARRCSIEAGLPPEVTSMNVNRLCASGLQSIVEGAQQLLFGDASIVVAGGNENMSRQPFLDYDARAGWRLGTRKLVDGTLSLITDPFDDRPMGITAENVAEHFKISRQEQDRFALQSQQRATTAIKSGYFNDQIVPVETPDSEFVQDEHPRFDITAEKLAGLKPVFKKGGTVTAGNSSGINDGAAAVVMMRQEEAFRRKLRPRLKLLGWAVTGIEPGIMGYAPALAIPELLKKTGFTIDEIDLVELNEAFASQSVAVIRDTSLSEEQVNVFGGAIALGHPVGATGTILTVKLLYSLEQLKKRYGIVTMCVGGGQGMAALFERPND